MKLLAQDFYQRMCVFFDSVEKTTGLKIIIALHPSSNYTPATFGNRCMLMGKTAELIRDSEAVLAHCSNAINFAVLWNKPLLLCHNIPFRECFIENKVLNCLIQNFRMPSCDTDTVKSIHFKKLEKEKRNEYMSYCTNKRIEGRNNVDLFKEYLVEIHEQIVCK